MLGNPLRFQNPKLYRVDAAGMARESLGFPEITIDARDMVSARYADVVREYASVKLDVDVCKSGTVALSGAGTGRAALESHRNKTYGGSKTAYLVDVSRAFAANKVHSVSPGMTGVPTGSSAAFEGRCGDYQSFDRNKRAHYAELVQAAKNRQFPEVQFDLSDDLVLGVLHVIDDGDTAEDVWGRMQDVAHGGEVVTAKLGGTNKLAYAFATHPQTLEIVRVTSLQQLRDMLSGSKANAKAMRQWGFRHGAPSADVHALRARHVRHLPGGTFFSPAPVPASLNRAHRAALRTSSPSKRR